LEDRRVHQVEVRIQKPAALRHARAAEVEIVRIQSTRRT
jgi:dihydroneopterin aldolase